MKNVQLNNNQINSLLNFLKNDLKFYELVTLLPLVGIRLVLFHIIISINSLEN